MRIRSELCLTISWLGILVRAEYNYPQNSESSENHSLVSQMNVRRDNKASSERRQRFSIGSDHFNPRVPTDFALEISKLRIPVAEDLPRRIGSSHEEVSRNESESDQDDPEGSGENKRDEEQEEDVDDYLDNDRTQEEEDSRGEGESADYDEYDSPHNVIPHRYEEHDKKPGQGKPTKKRPHVEYEVTEHIPHDTRTVRPFQKVYPMPPPCPGAPPPTYPTQPPKVPPPPPTFPSSLPTFPSFPKSFPKTKYFSHKDILDPYFPRSYISSSSSFPKSSFRRQGAAISPFRQIPKRNAQHGNQSDAITEPARPRYVLRYHQPALMIRKIKPFPIPVADRRVIIMTAAPPMKEVHIHHHHDSPLGKVHIHRDDEGYILDKNEFKGNVESQRPIGKGRFESATVGPFTEAPSNPRVSARMSA